MRYSVQQIINALATAERQGSATDQPEGSRYILLSETLANHFTSSLRAHLVAAKAEKEIKAEVSKEAEASKTTMITNQRRTAGLH